MSYVAIHKSQLLDSLENQVLFADLTSVIIGQKGLGKSFLLEKLHARLDGQVYISQISADSVMTPAQLEKTISLQLGLSWETSEQSLLEKINSTLEQRILLTVDDAHLLSLYCLDYLLGLVSKLNKQQNLFYIVLAGETNLAKKLNATPALKANPNLCVVFELHTFEESETRLLISDFNHIPEDKVDNLFDAQKINYFWQLSQGNPGELNTQLQRWIQEVNEQEKSSVLEVLKLKPKSQYILSAVYSSFALALVLALIYQDEINQIIVPDNTVITDNTIISGSTIISESTVIPENKLISEHTSTPKPQTRKIKLKTKSKTGSEVESPVSASLETPEHRSINKNTGQLQEEKKELAANVESSEKLSKVDTTDRSLVSEESKKRAAIEEANLVAETSVEVKNRDNVQLLVESENNLLTPDETSLLAMNSKSYTLQWMAVSSLKSAKAFKDQHQQKSSMLIFRRKLQDKFLFVLVSGQYSSRVDAENAKVTFKKRNYAGNPWVKSIEAVQKEISEH